MKKGFYSEHSVDKSAVNEDYFLHTHTGHEIFMFVSGNCQFNIEGNLYPLKPYDIVIASADELHRIVHLSPERYERYIIFLDSDFFVKNNCTQFANIFQKHNLGKNNYIDAETAFSSGLVDTIKKIQTYDAEGETTVAKSIIIELLYLLKKTAPSIPKESYNAKFIQDIVSYINEHLTENLTLNTLSDKFNISVSGIGNMFKKYMRMTIKSYITYKRLIYAQQLYKSGRTLLEASIEAGFHNYSNFYRMYVKEFNHSPKTDMKSR